MEGWQVVRISIWTFLSFIVLSGCAVQNGPRGKVQFGLDDAEIFGQTVESFKLADGGEGKLRVLGGKYSVKLEQQLKVVPIANATLVRVVSSDQIEGRTLLVLEKSERNCAYKTQLMSIQGAEVLSWDFGDCRNRPQATTYSDQATFDFVQPRRTVRYTYRDARLVRGEFPTPTTTSAATKPSPIGSPSLPTPAEPPAENKSSPTASARGSSPERARPQTTMPRRAPPPSPKALDFPTQEQKPVRIVLDD